MEIEVYCDESRPELFTTKKQTADKYMLIGSIWIPKDRRNILKDRIKQIRERHNVHGEIKWRSVSPSKLDFYKDMVSLFFDERDIVRFRCIVIDKNQVDLNVYHKGDAELGFYKFYYQLLHHWIREGNKYFVFTDTKTTRMHHRLKELYQILNKTNLFADIITVQAIPSYDSVFIQLADLLVGAVGYSCHSHNKSQAKNEVIELVTKKLNRTPCESTARDEKKFNVFRIKLDEDIW